MTGNIPSPLLAGERDRLKVLEGWERPPSCLDRGRGGASVRPSLNVTPRNLSSQTYNCHSIVYPGIIKFGNRESPWLQQWKLICRMLGWKQHRRDGSGANISPLLTDRVLFLPTEISRPGGEILAWGLFTKDSLLYSPSSHHQEHQNFWSAMIFSYF